MLDAVIPAKRFLVSTPTTSGVTVTAAMDAVSVRLMVAEMADVAEAEDMDAASSLVTGAPDPESHPGNIPRRGVMMGLRL
jgi:hypothetical protein